MDAFSSDAIPMHLLTQECIAMYWQHLAPDGILLVNISNRNVDLTPLIRAMAEGSGKQARTCHSGEDPERGTLVASWALITNNEEFLESGERRATVGAHSRRCRAGRLDRRLRQPMASAEQVRVAGDAGLARVDERLATGAGGSWPE